MSGAYVAKPDADTTQRLPPGWKPGWPFPGVNPPGYVNSYSIPVAAPATVTLITNGGETYSSDASVSATLRDYLVYETTRPDESSVIRWTAKIDGNAIRIKFSGAGEYSSCLESVYSDTGDFWGAAANMVFQLSEEDAGKTIVLTATTEVGGVEISGTSEIDTVAQGSYTVEADIIFSPISSTGRQGGISVNYLYESETVGSASAYFKTGSNPYNRSLQQNTLFETLISETETGWHIKAIFPSETNDTLKLHISCWSEIGFWVLPARTIATCSNGEQTLWTDDRTHDSGSSYFFTVSRKTGALNP